MAPQLPPSSTNPDFSALAIRASNTVQNNKPVAPVSIKQEDIFGQLKKQLDESLTQVVKFKDNVGNNIKGLVGGFENLNKSAKGTVKTIKAVETGVDAFGFVLKGVGKEVFQVGSALFVLSGAFFDVQQKVQLVAIPIKGVVDALGALTDKAKGVDLANSIGVDTTSIQQLELFKAGLFGNVEALQAFRTASQVSGINFTLNLTRLNTILKASKEELRGVGQEARKLSKELNGAVSSSDIVAGQYQIASAGFTNSGDSREIAEASAKLSVVGFNDFFSTADLVTKSLRAYGLEASKAADVAAKLNAVVEVGITTIPELAAGFAESAVTAKAFGIDLDQLGAAVATITTQGSSTAEALTGIEALFRTLATQSPQAVKALSELSLNGNAVKFDLATVQAKGLGNALTDVFKAANGNVETLRQIIPETRALQAALALAAQGGSLFAASLDSVSSSTPTKLNDIFGEVQEDPTIKLKSITTKADELVTSLGDSFTGFTDGAIKSLDTFVTGAEVLSNIPGVKQFISGLLSVGDTIGKAVGFISSLAGAGLAVVGTLASINLFNNLFNGGLVSQGKLIANSVLQLGDYSTALKQVVGIDTSKDVTAGLNTKLEELKAKAKGFSLDGQENSEESQKIIKDIDRIEQAIESIRVAAEKPIKLNLEQIESAKAEVLALEENINRLEGQKGTGTVDEEKVRAKEQEKALIKQREKVAEVGRLKLEQEKLLQKEVAKGNIKAEDAIGFRATSSQAVQDVSRFSTAVNNQGVSQRVTPVQNIKAELEEAKKKQPLNAERINNLSQSLIQASTGTQGLLNLDETSKNYGKLEQSFVKTGRAGQAFSKVGLGVARVYTALTIPLLKSRESITEVDKALRLASASEGISNVGQAAGKLFSTAGTGLGLLKTGALAAGKGLLSLGGSLISQFLNPLTIALSVAAAGLAIFDRFQQAEAFRSETIEKNAEAERKRTEAIENTNKALSEQKRIDDLIKGGLTREEATKKISTEKQESNIRQAVGTATGDRKQRLQTQLATRDFRTSDEFITSTLSEKRDNRLGVATATDGGQAKRKLQGDATNTAVLATTGAVVGGSAAAASLALAGGSVAVGSAIVGAFGVGAASAGATIGATLGSIAPGLGTLIGAGIGLAIGVGVSQLFATAEAEDEKKVIKQEFLNRKETELTDKFKVNEAATPEERAKRRAKVKGGLDLASKEADIAQNQSGINNSVLDNLRKQTDPIQKDIVDRIDLFAATITELKTDTDTAIAGLDKNQLEAGLLSEDLTAKANKVLSGRSQVTAEDTSRVEAELKGRIDSLKVIQQGLEETLNDPKLEAAEKSLVKDRIAKGAKQIEDTTNASNKIKSKLASKNTDIINQTASGQGVGANIAFKEETSAVTNINNIKKALEDDTEAARNTIPNLLDSLKASSENLGALDTGKLEDVNNKIKNLLSLKDTNGQPLISKLDPKVVLGVINTVTENIAKLAGEKIGKLEASARRLQGLAANTEVAGSTVAKESIDQTELQVLDVKIKAQEEIAAIAQGAAAKEKALNDLAQLQLEKKNKTIEARITKEINAANLLYEREKARLGLTQTELELKAQIFDKFGIVDNENTAAIFANKEQQLVADQNKQRADLARQQEASIQQSEASVQTNLQAPISIEAQIKAPKFDSSSFDKQEQELEAQLRDKTEEININSDKQIADRNNRFAKLQGGRGRKQTAINLESGNQKDRSQADAEIKRLTEEFEEKRVDLTDRKNLAEAEFTQQQKKQPKTATSLNSLKNIATGRGSEETKNNILKVATGQGQEDKQTDEVKKRNAEQKKILEDKLAQEKKQLALQKQLAIYDGVIKKLEIIKGIEQERLNITTSTTNTVLGDKSFVAAELSLKTQLTINQQNFDLEKKKIDLQEKALKDTGNLNPEAKKKIASDRSRLDNSFKNEQAVVEFQGKKDIAEKSSGAIQETLSSTVALAATLKQVDSAYVSQANSQTIIALNNRLQTIAVTETLALERQKLDLQEQALKASGNLTAEAQKEIETRRKLLDNQFAAQAISLKFSAKQESLDAIANKLKTTIESKVKGLSLQKDALATFADSFGEDDSKQAQDAKKLAGALAINIAVQQAALEENLLKIQQEKVKFTLEETQLKLKLLDIDLQLKESEAKTPEQKAALADARKSVAELQGNVAGQIKELPAQFAAQQQLQKQQSTLAVSTAALQYTKEFDPKNLKAAQQQFLSANNGNLAQPVGNTSVGNAVASLNQQVQTNSAASNPPAAPRNDIVPVFRTADGSITNINPNPTTQIDFERQKQQERIAVASQQQQQQVRLLQDGSITNIPDKNNQSSQNSAANNNAFTINVNVNGNADNAVATNIGKTVRQELLELSRRFQ